MEKTSDEVMEAGRTTRFFRKVDWGAFWTATVISFCVYLYTMGPTVGLEDSGELAVAGDYLGVPHPPGYPIWTMLAWLFARVFSFVTFRGQPNPAWGISLLSVVFGAVAAGMTAMLVCRSGSDMLQQSRHALHKVGHGTEDLICWTGGVVCSLLFAFSPVMWSQSVIVEVYSLNAFFLMLIFLLTYRWMCRPSDKVLYLTAFIFGLGLTNYQVLLLAALPLVIVIMFKDVGLFRDFVITGAPFLLVLGLIKLGVLPAIVHPTHHTFYIYMFLNLLALMLAFLFLPRGRTVALTFLLAEMGVAFYVYMPIVSDLRNPPMNWGYPRTWEGFLHAIGRKQYEAIKPTDVLSPRFLHQLGAYLSDLRRQFYLPLALLGFLPFTVWSISVERHRVRAVYAAIGLSIAASFLVVMEQLGPGGAATGGLVMTYRFLILGVLALAGVGGLIIFVNRITEQIEELSTPDAPPTEWFFRILILVGLFGLGLAMLVLYEVMQWRALASTLDALGEGAAAARGLAMLKTVLMMVIPLGVIPVVVWLTRSKHKLSMAIDHNSQKWVIATLAGFLVMSIMLIALANPKGDIQDNFIQRVKFISSHALFAVWIGYGMIFSLAFVDTLFKSRRALTGLFICGALGLSFAPIYKNAFDARIIEEYGGAEQTNHDFGWQFGNYQLRGAEAVMEELDPDEEPLPNPSYPPEMGRDAVFFGGTDPGRFVPTYMIYSARVREDVFLITQNALADNTYMSVMRDLYGEDIWIPARSDSAKAFQVYVEEVKAGKRPKNAELKIENGRVQVSGALGVMEINGILARMIFDHNNYKHPFYVEESYVIRWMYPFLEPHGLIMKINAAKLPGLSEEMVRNDQDFWDWYVRRLHGDSRFTRDIVARKSFSKLRSAIAGLYSSRRMYGDAETAYNQSRILYPLSPEASFRLTQEVLMPGRRYEDALDLMSVFGNEDPGNTKVPQLIEHLDGILKLDHRVSELEARQKTTGKLSVNEAFELGACYGKLGQRSKLAVVMRGLLANKDLPPKECFQVARMLHKAKLNAEMDVALQRCVAGIPPGTSPQILVSVANMYRQVGRPDRMEPLLQSYLKMQPRDWRGWLDLCTVYTMLKKEDEATRCLQEAIRYGGDEALAIIQKNDSFAPLLKKATDRARSFMKTTG